MGGPGLIVPTARRPKIMNFMPWILKIWYWDCDLDDSYIDVITNKHMEMDSILCIDQE